jgi:NhaP-type Na+/H+ or K+/H+ antiporter
MLPVAISLIGSKLRLRTVLFVGWFGPRGLASIVLGLIVLEEAESIPGVDKIGAIVMLTMVLSVFAHGISANPYIKRYHGHVELDEEAAEKKKVPQLPTRKVAKPHLHGSQ